MLAAQPDPFAQPQPGRRERQPAQPAHAFQHILAGLCGQQIIGLQLPDACRDLDAERRAGRWNGDAPPPPLPAEIVDATSKRYLEAYRRLTGAELAVA